jgi:hypothetical protein
MALNLSVRSGDPAGIASPLLVVILPAAPAFPAPL